METPEVPNDPLSQFSLAIFYVNGLLMNIGDRVMQAIGQSSAKWQVLGRAGYQPQTVAQMAREMGHARQSVQRVADVLVKEGLIVYRNNPVKRRSPLLELTPQGAATLEAIYALNEESAQRIMSKLDAGKLVEIADALEEIGRVLESEDQPTKKQNSTLIESGGK